mgnify:CR=1 FL=1
MGNARLEQKVRDDMTPVTTRDARASDGPAIVRMMTALSRHHDDIARIEVEDLMFLCFGPAPWMRLIVAERDGAIVGYAAMQRKVQLQFARRFLDVQHLFVSDDARGQGVGRALMQSACEYARLQRCAEVALGVMPANLDARAFYEQLGFAPHDKGDAILLLR